MAQVCKVCSHPKVKEIERLLVRGTPNLRIASTYKLSEKNVRDHRNTHFAEYLERAVERAREDRELTLKVELVQTFNLVKALMTAANKMLVDTKTGEINLRKKNAMAAANLVLKASEKLDRHLRMVGDLTGEFKQPQTNPQNVSKRLYEEFVNWFLKICHTINPELERRVVIETLAEMPETAGEFMPMIKEELNQWVM